MYNYLNLGLIWHMDLILRKNTQRLENQPILLVRPHTVWDPSKATLASYDSHSSRVALPCHQCFSLLLWRSAEGWLDRNVVKLQLKRYFGISWDMVHWRVFFFLLGFLTFHAPVESMDVWMPPKECRRWVCQNISFSVTSSSYSLLCFGWWPQIK